MAEPVEEEASEQEPKGDQRDEYAEIVRSPFDIILAVPYLIHLPL